MEQHIAVRQVLVGTLMACLAVLFIGFIQLSMQYSDLKAELDYANEAWTQSQQDLQRCEENR